MDNQLIINTLERHCQELLTTLEAELEKKRQSNNLNVWAYIGALHLIEEYLTKSIDISYAITTQE